MLALSCIVSLLLSQLAVGVSDAGAAAEDARTVVLVCNLVMTVFYIATTLLVYGGTASSRVSVALLYSAVCFTSFIGIDLVLAPAGLGFGRERCLLSTVAHLAATAAVYLLVSRWVVGRMREMIAATNERLEWFVPVLAVMFAVLTVDCSMLVYRGDPDLRGLSVDAMVLVSSILCLYLILTKLDSEIRVDGYRRELDAAWIGLNSANVTVLKK